MNLAALMASRAMVVMAFWLSPYIDGCLKTLYDRITSVVLSAF